MVGNILFRIAIPTILFSAINYFPKMIVRGSGIDLWTFTRDTFLGGSLWFTCSLAVAESLIFVLLITRLKNISFYFVCTLLLALVGIGMTQYSITIRGDPYIPWYYKSGMIASLYLALGGLFWKIEHVVDSVLTRYLWLTVVACYFLSLYLFPDVRVSINICSLNLKGFIVSILGIVMCVCASKKLPNSALIRWIGKHTLGLYFLSGGIPNLLAIILLKTGVPVNGATCLLLAVISFILASCAVIIIEKYIPFLFDVRYINRKYKTH